MESGSPPPSAEAGTRKEDITGVIPVKKGPTKPFISLVELIARPNEFDMHEVTVAGYLSITSTDHGLFLSRDFAHVGALENALWVQFGPCGNQAAPKELIAREQAEAFSLKYVHLRATFVALGQPLWAGMLCAPTAIASLEKDGIPGVGWNKRPRDAGLLPEVPVSKPRR
jgi:hypothetical protein